jgi:hypothetical protein
MSPQKKGLSLYACSQHVVPIALGSYGSKRKWSEAENKILRRYKTCPGTPAQGIFSDFPPGPSPKLSFLTSSQAWPWGGGGPVSPLFGPSNSLFYRPLANKVCSRGSKVGLLRGGGHARQSLKWVIAKLSCSGGWISVLFYGKFSHYDDQNTGCVTLWPCHLN